MTGRNHLNRGQPTGLKRQLSILIRRLRSSPTTRWHTRGSRLLQHACDLRPKTSGRGISVSKGRSAEALAVMTVLPKLTHRSRCPAQGEWKWTESEREFRRAILLNPKSAQAHQWYANLLAAQVGRDEAIAQTKQAQELDSNSLSSARTSGWCISLPIGTTIRSQRVEGP